MKKKLQPPKVPPTRYILEGAINVVGICPICHSTTIRRPWIFGRVYCCNNECENNKKPIP